jgi:hypothetical protein
VFQTGQKHLRTRDYEAAKQAQGIRSTSVTPSKNHPSNTQEATPPSTEQSMRTCRA